MEVLLDKSLIGRKLGSHRLRPGRRHFTEHICQCNECQAQGLSKFHDLGLLSHTRYVLILKIKEDLKKSNGVY